MVDCIVIFKKNRICRYIDVLFDIVDNYNFILNRSFNGIVLNKVIKKNEVDVWVVFYFKKFKMIKKLKFNEKIEK